ncbi:MAG: ParB/RepB/Spo0J family partition protein [Firmicutes bacterium]|nr:ParB/RepB/Spo0J family partition protein [Bacillota bacterium]
MNNEKKDEVVYLNLDDIIPNRFQPREVFDERALKELAISIKEHGVIQPIIVRNVNGKYEIIAGERRYKASALAGLTKIPAIIRDMDDKESSKVALLENLQRKNLNAIEEARTYQKILELDEMTQDELAKTMGKSQSAVANKIRLLSLPDEVQDAVLKEKISERHARALLQVPDTKKQKEFLKKIVADRMPVRKLENEIKELYPKDDNEEVAEKRVEEVVNIKNDPIGLPDSDVVAVSTDFVNDTPLAPTTNLEEEKSNYGKVVIAPPEGEEENMPKFINYGEIDDDEDDNKDDNKDLLNSSNTSPSIEDIKSNTEDLNKREKNAADLDNLLNISSKSTTQNNRFITPAEGIVKNDQNEDTDKNEDYFKTPDLVSIELPSEIQTKDTESVSIRDLEETREQSSSITVENDDEDIYTIQAAVEKLRNFVKKLNQNDLKADMEEMNFSKSYQIIIKLEKNDD